MGVRDQAVKQTLQLITDPSLDKAMTIARQHEQVKLQTREQHLEQDQHVAEARVSPSPRIAGPYTKRKDRHTANNQCERCGYTEHFAERVALRWDRGAISLVEEFVSVCRSKCNTEF